MDQRATLLDERRLSRVRDAMLGISYWLSEPDAFLYPFVDYLFLLVQKPCVLRLRSEVGGLHFPRLASPSPGHDDFHSGYELSLPETEELSRCDLLIGFDSLEKHSPDLRVLFEHDDVLDTNRGDAFRKKLNVSFHETRSQQDGQREKSPVRVEPEEENAWLKPMCNVVEQALQPVLKSEFHWIPNTEIGNIFAAVHIRHGTSSGSGRAKPVLLLTSSCREALERWWVGHVDESQTYMRLPEEPVRRMPTNTVGFESNDWLRQLEQKTAGLPRGVLGRFDGMFRAPIHVNGVPWVMLFRLITDESEQWYNNFNFYREVLPRLASNIRTGAKDVYIDLLAERLEEHLQTPSTTPEEFAKAVTKEWSRVAQVYPFEPVELTTHASSPQDNVIVLPEGGKFCISVSEQGSQFRRDLSYDPLRPNDVVEVCQRTVNDYRGTTKKAEDRSVAKTTHLLRTPLARLRGFIGEVGDQGQRRGLRAQVDNLIRLEKFSNYIVDPKGGKKQRELLWETRPPETFAQELVERVKKSIETHKLKPYMGEKARLVRQMEEAGQIRIESIREVASEYPGQQVKYFPEQMQVVVNGLLSNAFRYCSRAYPLIVVSCVAQPDFNGHGFFLTVRNTSGRTEEELDQLARDLTSHAQSGWIGISIIHHACDACDFDDPRWRALPNSTPPHELEATAQVAKLNPKRRPI